MHQPFDTDVIFVIGRDKDDLTAVLECRLVERDGYKGYACTDGRVGTIPMPANSQIFKTREAAQKELDELTTYIHYRMSSHKK